jgi:hypothetical protein
VWWLLETAFVLVSVVLETLMAAKMKSGKGKKYENQCD